MKKLIFYFFLLIGVTAFAQPKPPVKPERPDAEKMESIKVAFITEKLELTPKEAEAFWPLYKQYEKELKTIRTKQREANKQFSQKTTPTEQEADKLLTEYAQLKQQEVDIIKRYIPEFKKILPNIKVARLLSIEHEFKMQLLHRLKEPRHPDK
jgi:predicted  nucleic acid-binding Zn-ribbon protein